MSIKKIWHFFSYVPSYKQLQEIDQSECENNRL